MFQPDAIFIRQGTGAPRPVGAENPGDSLFINAYKQPDETSQDTEGEQPDDPATLRYWIEEYSRQSREISPNPESPLSHLDSEPLSPGSLIVESPGSRASSQLLINWRSPDMDPPKSPSSDEESDFSAHPNSRRPTILEHPPDMGEREQSQVESDARPGGGTLRTQLMRAFSAFISRGKHPGVSSPGPFDLFAAQPKSDQPPEYSRIKTIRFTVEKCRMLRLYIDQLDAVYTLALGKVPHLEERTQRIDMESSPEEKSRLRDEVKVLQKQITSILKDGLLSQNVFPEVQNRMDSILGDAKRRLEEEQTKRSASSYYFSYIQQDLADVECVQNYFGDGKRSYTIVYTRLQEYLTRLDALSKELEPPQSLENRHSRYLSEGSGVQERNSEYLTSEEGSIAQDIMESRFTTAP